MTNHRPPVRRLAGAALLAVLAAGCSSNEPYTAPQPQASNRLPRAPVVAPSGPSSPWWWPAPDSWWPFE